MLLSKAKFGIFALVLTLGSAILFFELSIKESLNKTISDSLEQASLSQQNAYKKAVDDNIRFLYFLVNTPPIQGIARALNNDGVDPKDGTETRIWKERLAVIFRSLLYSNGSLNQLRLIDAKSGLEMVKVYRNLEQVIIESERKLQDKSAYPYWHKAIQIPERSIYSGPINLNREFGKITIPIQPTKRFSTPVFDENNELFFVLVINANAQNMVESMALQGSVGKEFMILDAAQRFIYHPKQEFRFTADLKPEIHFEDVFSTSPWSNRLILLTERTTGTRFIAIFTKLYDSDLANSDTTIVNYLPLSHYTEMLNEKRLSTYLLLLFTVLVFSLVIYAFWKYAKGLQALDATKAEFKAILDGAADAVIGFAISGELTSFNESSRRFFAWVGERNLGKHASKFTSLPYEYLASCIEKLGSAQSIHPLESELETPIGKIWAEFRVSPIYGSRNELVGVALFVEDATNRKEAEQQVLSAKNELEAQVEQRTKELVLARDKAAKASQVKSAFISTISHEMRTPLNGILGALNLLQKQPMNDVQAKYLEVMDTSSSALLALINDVLDLSKIEAGKLEIDLEAFNPLSVIEHVAMTMVTKAAEKNLVYFVDQTKLGHIELVGDASRVKQLIFNLVSNAIKFTKQGHVIIQASSYQKDNQVWLRVVVIDSGIGIDENNHSKLFQAFSQESASIANEFGGTGLGLSICAQLVMQMQGRINFDSKKGQGSKFWFELPFALETAKPLVVAPVLEGKTARVIGFDSHLEDYISALIRLLSGQVTNQADSDIDIKQISEDSIATPTRANVSIDKKKLEITLTQNNKVSDRDGTVSLKLPLRLAEFIAIFDKKQAQKLQTNLSNLPIANVCAEKQLTDKHYLVVDDNQINRIVAKGILESYGAKVSFAVDGQDAINKLLLLEHQGTELDAVLMDCNMPGMDGYQSTRAIRQGHGGDIYSQIPIIAMTASAMAGEKERCFSSGMDGFVSKPIVPAQLLSVLLSTSTELAERSVSEQHDDNKLHVNEAASLKRLMDDELLLIEVYELFLQHGECFLEELNEAITARSHAKIAQLSHAFKGQAVDIGADYLAEYLAKLERAAKQCEPAIYDETLAQIQTEYGQVVFTVEGRCKTVNTIPPENK
ncbi:ATP-binding protein (plasmid) [Pseudoalteromonas sp. T1lg65]|uniref:hybrid sensor histidine kinase/response regulator n=1 Tax=Pseudoalteromonas sp. T1lg65 TaxID=2077101 RepID=UPI003F7B26E6